MSVRASGGHYSCHEHRPDWLRLRRRASRAPSGPDPDLRPHRRLGTPLPARPPPEPGPRGRARRALRAPQTRARLGVFDQRAVHCAHEQQKRLAGSEADRLPDRRLCRDLRVQADPGRDRRRRVAGLHAGDGSAARLRRGLAAAQAVIYLALALWFGVATGLIGRVRGSLFFIWFIIGAVVSILGLVVALAYRSDRD